MPDKTKPIKQELKCGYQIKNTTKVCKVLEGRYICFCAKWIYYSHKYGGNPPTQRALSQWLTDWLIS